MDADASGLEHSLVVTGSSAGGVDALIAFVGGLPRDFAAPVVIAQHQSPGQENRLVDILCSRTSLDVIVLGERAKLLPGTVYVVGADRDVEVIDGSATLVTRAARGPKPSIDRLFRTAAQSHGEQLFAIVFSGMGTDGLIGARAVKEYGGTVIVQEPETATYPNMPAAIPPNVVDMFARPEAIGTLLAELLRGAASPKVPADQSALRSLLVQLRDRSGVDFTQYKMPTIMRRLSRLMVAAGVDSIPEYQRHLQQHPESYGRLVSAFLIKVTEFFRDAALFDALRATIVPRLMADAREAGRELRIWSAGTSTGEEAYSLAIVCAELMRESGDELPVRIFATDLDEQAIVFARRGLYSFDALRHVPAPWIERYFVRSGEAFEVGKRIRNMTVFGQHDLNQRAPFPRIDLCLCRNVLIYFTKELQNRALQMFAFSLRDTGFLVLGKAESPGTTSEYFRAVNTSVKIYERQGDRNVIPSTRFRETMTSVRADAARGERPLLRSAPTVNDRAVSGDALGVFASGAAIGVVVVDRRYDIHALNATARAMLEIHGIGVGEDLLHLVHNADPVLIRALIDGTFANEPVDTCELAVKDPEGEERWLHASAAIDRSGGGRSGDRAAIFFVDITPSALRARELERTSAEQRERLSELGGKLDEVLRRQRALLLANDQLTEANAELRTANEQLVINAEEAASANEEVETLNEEMQATNEELETLNEELQATVEELNTSNEELGARSGDLESRARREGNGSVRNKVGEPIIVAAVCDDDVVYASPEIERALLANLPAGWSRETALAIGGERFAGTPFPAQAPAYVVFAPKK